MQSESKLNTMKDNLLNYGSFSTFRNAIYGMAALWIVFFHATILDAIRFEPEFIFKTLDMGNIGVDIFFFLSGISLYFSFSRKPKLGVFYYKRFIRVYLPYLMMALPYMIYLLAAQTIDVWTFLKGVFLVNSLLGEGMPIDFWYLSTILLFYLAYPLIYRFIFGSEHDAQKEHKLSEEKRRLLKTLSLAAGSIALAALLYYVFPDFYKIIDRIPSRLTVFILGSYAGKAVMEKKRFSIWFLVIAVLIVAGSYPLYGYGILPGVWYRYYGSLTGIALVYLWSQLFALMSTFKGDKVFAFFGVFSLEIYIMSIVARRIYLATDWYGGPYSFGCYMIVMAIAILVAWLINLLEKPLINLLMKGKKKE